MLATVPQESSGEPRKYSAAKCSRRADPLGRLPAVDRRSSRAHADLLWRALPKHAGGSPDETGGVFVLGRP
jgi:hypothetical protein